MLGKDIHKLVKVKLEEYSPYNPDVDGPLLSSGDVYDEIKPIGAYIEAHLSEAANEILLAIPTNKLNSKCCDNYPDEDEDDPFIGTVDAPCDFLKIHTFCMEGWKKPVRVAYKAGDYMDSRQVYVATRGNIYKPVVVEERIYDEFERRNKVVLHYYSTTGEHEIKTFLYVPVFSDEENYIDRVAELIALNCAKKVCEVFERTESIGIIDKEIQSLFQLIIQ